METMHSLRMFSIFIIFTFLVTLIAPVCSQIRCLEDQKHLLLKFKDELDFYPLDSGKLVHWNEVEDCCSWDGVGCDGAGHVISLELDSEGIFAMLENSTSLFNLEYLERLNLAFNYFSNLQIPSKLHNLTNLKHLNLSNAGFAGQIPFALSTTRSLVSLDLSSDFYSHQLKLDNPDLKRLVQNLTELTELNLDGVDFAGRGKEWSQNISSFLPNLRVLSLRDCYLSGPIDSSLSQLYSLSVLQLDSNDLSIEVPDFFANFSKLTTLTMADCSLQGLFPSKILQVPTLKNLDLSFNEFLSGTLPQFPWTTSLDTLVLTSMNLSGSLPDSISNLENLVHLELSNNNFTSYIPVFNLSKKLAYVDLSFNQLTGSLSFAHFESLLDLESVNLEHNLISGNLPPALFMLPSLQALLLSNNQLDGKLVEVPNPTASNLKILDLSSNKLGDRIPIFLFKFEGLTDLLLSFNFFNGTFQLEMIRNIRDLTRLDVSCNNLTVDSSNIGSDFSFYHDLQYLNLASCKLQKFPQLLRKLNVSWLDLSANQIEGEIPAWMWEINNGGIRSLNLSFNQLTGFQRPCNISSFDLIDISYNHLSGELPIPTSFSYLDYSNNNFNGTIPTDIGYNIFSTWFFSVSNNNLTGVIPSSICTTQWFSVLDLSNNALTGSIPLCHSLSVLNLRGNKLSGNIPNSFSDGCPLRTLDLSQNFLTGYLPRSLLNCTNLEVLNTGNNQIEDTFPCMLMNTDLRVLVVRSNRFHGDLHCPETKQGWPKLQIFDISNNNFSGDLPPSYFLNWNGMIKSSYGGEMGHNNLGLYLTTKVFYRDTVTLTIKGQELELKKILVIFTSIDLSRNKLTGKVPDAIGDFKSLHFLNLSSNAFTGGIPTSIGSLVQLESLDLSGNHLTGKIPEQLVSLTFLSFLNLSFNSLSGMIPLGRQLRTFSVDSFKGNDGLCGFPLSINCESNEKDGMPPLPLLPPPPPNTEINWTYVFAALGFVTGLGIVGLTLLFCRKWRERFFDQVEEVLLKIFHEQRERRRRKLARVTRNQTRRF